MSYRGNGDFQTNPDGTWHSHHMRSDPSTSLEERWISIPPNVWHQGLVGPDDWVVVSFHTVPEQELIEERPAAGAEAVQQRRYAADRDMVLVTSEAEAFTVAPCSGFLTDLSRFDVAAQHDSGIERT
jgi:hypothetical protein